MADIPKFSSEDFHALYRNCEDLKARVAALEKSQAQFSEGLHSVTSMQETLDRVATTVFKINDYMLGTFDSRGMITEHNDLLNKFSTLSTKIDGLLQEVSTIATKCAVQDVHEKRIVELESTVRELQQRRWVLYGIVVAVSSIFGFVGQYLIQWLL